MSKNVKMSIHPTILTFFDILPPIRGVTPSIKIVKDN